MGHAKRTNDQPMKSRSLKRAIAAAEQDCAAERRDAQAQHTAANAVTPPPQLFDARETPAEKRARIVEQDRQRGRQLKIDKADPKGAALRKVASTVGVPTIQRGTDTLAIETTAIVDGHTRPTKETVRKFSRMEMLQRQGTLSAREAAACQWYADRHALGFDTIGCTANYEGAGGGGCHEFDLLARHGAQAIARDDYLDARKQLAAIVPAAHLALFEEVILGQDTIGEAATRAFALARSQSAAKAGLVLRLCANRLGMIIGHLLPIDPVEIAPAPVPAPASDLIPTEKPAAANSQSDRALRLFLDGAIARARAGGTVGAIRIAPRTKAALQRESGCRDAYGVLPLVVVDEWSWGYVVISADELALGALAAVGTDQGTEPA